MRRRLVLRTVECRTVNEDKGDWIKLVANGVNIFEINPIHQGDVIVPANLAGFDDTWEFEGPIRIVGYETDETSANDFIGEVNIPESETDLVGQLARLPAEGSDYNGVYYITYDLSRL